MSDPSPYSNLVNAIFRHTSNMAAGDTQKVTPSDPDQKKPIPRPKPKEPGMPDWKLTAAIALLSGLSNNQYRPDDNPLQIFLDAHHQAANDKYQRALDEWYQDHPDQDPNNNKKPKPLPPETQPDELARVFPAAPSMTKNRDRASNEMMASPVSELPHAMTPNGFLYALQKLPGI